MNKFIIFCLLLFNFGTVYADGWTPRLTCENSSFVVDGYFTSERGFVKHQVVIRNGNAINYFSSLTKRSLNNSSGELIREFSDFSGAFITPIDPFAFNPFYQLDGHWLDGGRYEISISVINQFNAGVAIENPQILGNWIFNHCTWIQ